MPLTEEAQVEYLENFGRSCPYCGNANSIRKAIPTVEEEGMILLSRLCGACGKRWSDLYTLVGVEE